MSTQAEVAERAGVSRRTVSNVVNGYPHISADVLRRVRQAIDELGYTPSQAARSLRLGRSGVIQLVIPELDVPYFAELARGIVIAAERKGLSVMVRQTLGDARAERDALYGSAAEYAEGTILSPVDGALEWLEERNPATPVVLIGETQHTGRFDHVGIDDETAAYDATMHLVAQGRRRIAFVGSDPRNRLLMARKRERGYRSALAEAEIAIDERLVVPTQAYHRSDGRKALDELLTATAPDAAFCATDLLALGLLRQAFNRGLAVPEDIAVVGFDDLEDGRYSVPSLSTIAPDKTQIASAVVDAVVARMESPAAPGSETAVDYRLIVRESSKK